MRIYTRNGVHEAQGRVAICPTDSDSIQVVEPTGFGFEVWPNPGAWRAIDARRVRRAAVETVARAVCAIGGGLVGYFWHWLFSGGGV